MNFDRTRDRFRRDVLHESHSRRRFMASGIEISPVREVLFDADRRRRHPDVDREKSGRDNTQSLKTNLENLQKHSQISRFAKFAWTLTYIAVNYGTKAVGTGAIVATAFLSAHVGLLSAKGVELVALLSTAPKALVGAFLLHTAAPVVVVAACLVVASYFLLAAIRSGIYDHVNHLNNEQTKRDEALGQIVGHA